MEPTNSELIDFSIGENTRKPGSKDIAPKPARLLNFLIDNSILGFFFTYLAFLVFSRGALPFLKDWYFAAPFMMVVVIAYYSFFESQLGKTIGKMVTGTRVVDHERQPLEFPKALLRSLVRFIPADPFSILFGQRAWHDLFTNTYVVKD